MLKNIADKYIVFDMEGFFEEEFTDYLEARQYFRDMKEVYPTHEIHIMSVMN